MRGPSLRKLAAGGCAIAFAAAVSISLQARADAPQVTIALQPMVSTGLAAGQPFEAWFVFDKSSDPAVPGHGVPAGTTIRFTFPKEFTPAAGPLTAVMLTGWPQGSIPARFTASLDDRDPRTIVIRLETAISAGPPEQPGLKAIHLRTGEINPGAAGDYSIALRFLDAGALSGTTEGIAHITPEPIANIAAYNQLHGGRDEDWQHVKPGAEAALPIDLLVTLPDKARPSIEVNPAPDGGLVILSDGAPIGSIRTEGAPVTLAPHPFGPGFARLGIVEVRARAGATPGSAKILAQLDGSARCVINLFID
jgi:hypothetical protein